MKKLAIVGMAETTRHLAPWDDEDYEIWGMNEAYFVKGGDGIPYFKRWDRWFQMHPKWDYMKADNFNHMKHVQWITNAPWELDELAEIELLNKREETAKFNDDKHKIEAHPEMNGATLESRRGTDFPIYMLEQFDDIPGCVVYPFEDVIHMIPSAAEYLKYFTQSFSYMIALGLYEGFDEIHVYGIEMGSSTEYGYQKPCAEFWLGVALGMGKKLVLTPKCKLLGGTTELYGYDKTAGLTRMHLEIERNTYAQKFNEAREGLGKIEGETLHLKKLMEGSLSKGKREKYDKRLLQLDRDRSNLLIPVNVFNHGLRLRTNDIAKLDGMPTNDDIQFILPRGRGDDET